MKIALKSGFFPAVLASLTALFLFASCETDNTAAPAPSSAAAHFQNVQMDAPPPGVDTVRMKIESSPPDADVSLNGSKVGFTPKEVHLAVDNQGRLTIPVTITINYQLGNGTRMAMGGEGVGAGPRDSSYTYAVGDRVPATLAFNSDMRVEGRTPAPFDTKHTPADARRED